MNGTDSRLDRMAMTVCSEGCGKPCLACKETVLAFLKEMRLPSNKMLNEAAGIMSKVGRRVSNKEKHRLRYQSMIDVLIEQAERDLRWDIYVEPEVHLPVHKV